MDTIAFRKIDASSFDDALKKAEEEVSRIREVFPKDGKTLAFTEKAKNAKKQDVNSIYVSGEQ